jgi:hypothetical protein
VPDFCTCGAQLPEAARFCHKCGKPQYDYPGLVEESTQPETQPEAPPVAAPKPAPTTDIGFHNRIAVRIGFLAAVTAILLGLFPLPFPIVRLMVSLPAAGFLAVFLYSRRTGQLLSIRAGARMGWITGVFCCVLVAILAATSAVAISNQGGQVKVFRSQLPPNDPRADTLAQAISDPSTLVGVLLMSFLMLFIVLTALPMIGGALGAKVLAKE